MPGREFIESPSCILLWNSHFLLKSSCHNLGLRAGWCNINFHITIVSGCFTMQVNNSIAILDTGTSLSILPVFSLLWIPLFFFFSFTSCSGRECASVYKLCSPISWAWPGTPHFYLLALLKPQQVSNENDGFHLEVQIEWVGNEVTAGGNVYSRHMLFLSSQWSNPYFILRNSLLLCMCFGERSGH